MAGNSVIGALRVNLGIDSAEFSSGLKKAQSGLAGFGKTAAVGFGIAATAAVAAGAALAVMGKRAIDGADDLSKAAQKAGVTTEALSRLKYAADFSDVALTDLSGGLQKLSKNMADVASGKGGSAATALSALGISVKDSTGALRGSDEVLADIADRFSRLEDGSTKTALAIQLFGKSGAELIPLLNSGRDGLKQMADESDQLGLTISTKTGRAAEQFNDTLTKVGKIIDGVVMKVAEAALPSLQALADVLVSPRFAQGAQTFGVAVVDILIKIAEGAANAANNIRMIADALGSVERMSSEGLNGRLREIGLAKLQLDNLIVTTQGKLDRGEDLFGINRGPLEAQITKAKGDITALIEQEREILEILKERESQQGAADGASGSAGDTKPPDFVMPTFGDPAAAEKTAARLQAFRESLMTEEQYEIASHAKRLEELTSFYEAGAIKKSEYDSLLEAEQKQHSERMSDIVRQQVEEESRIRQAILGNVAGIFGSLATIAENANKENLGIAKAFGVAQVVVSTAAGIMKAFEQTGIGGWISAAAIAAEGVAQISTIMTAQPGGTGGASVGGGGPASTAAAQVPARPGLTLEFNGTPNDMVRQGDVAEKFQELVDYLGVNGMEFAFTFKGA